ncbi:hypothetical protein SAMN05216224_1011019 [Thioclava dalianensis]|uniref:hypothetical protein n=1 Tax=Thioclava dalianensis TaxID=1185766 RepID=UPI0008F61D53|nr:hypothetical protein [Thioclava dalianensis]SFM93633.1 hypothetical protein SAMN05216224_1011019 [Thioclava dalianensis]
MKRIATALVFAVLSASAASAGIGDFNLPRLDFQGGNHQVTQASGSVTQVRIQR